MSRAPSGRGNGSGDLSAREVVDLLDLKPLSGEGGWFRQTYRAPLSLPAGLFPAASSRPAGTAILYLLTPDDHSALHRLPFDELFHFYLGDPVTMLQLPPEGRSRTLTLGPDLISGQSIQTLVPAKTWQGSLLVPGGRWALLGTTMAPGFDPADLELADPERLLRLYPDRAELIRRLAPAAANP